MWLRLRQVALVARDIEAVVADLRAVFGLDVAYIDPGVAVFGLQNRLLPVGSQFIEIVSPVRDGTAGGRYLERRGGDGGYMVITQCDEHPARKRHVESLGIRKVLERDHPEHCLLQLHPADTGGSFLEIDWHRDLAADGDWPPAGEDWRRAVRTERVNAITGVELQSDRPGELAGRWSEIIETRVVADAQGNPSLALENATIRFIAATDGRGEGLGGVDVRAVDRETVLAAARARGVPVEGSTVTIAGTRFRLA